MRTEQEITNAAKLTARWQ